MPRSVGGVTATADPNPNPDPTACGAGALPVKLAPARRGAWRWDGSGNRAWDRDLTARASACFGEASSQDRVLLSDRHTRPNKNSNHLTLGEQGERAESLQERDGEGERAKTEAVRVRLRVVVWTSVARSELFGVDALQLALRPRFFSLIQVRYHLSATAHDVRSSVARFILFHCVLFHCIILHCN